MVNTIIATTTFYRDPRDIRVQLAYQLVHDARRLGFEVVIVDGGSDPQIVNNLELMGARVYAEEQPGMGPSRRQALRLAAKVVGEGGVVIWTEPEKYPLILYLESVAEHIFSGKADMVIPGRESFASFPDEQMDLELAGNCLFKSLTGKALDTWFGPMALNAQALQYFLDYQGEHGDLWDSIHAPRVRVIAAGLRVEEVRIPYLHPWEQKKRDSGNPNVYLKRLTQQENLVRAYWKEAYQLGLTIYKPPENL